MAVGERLDSTQRRRDEMDNTISYLNTDLDVASADDLTGIAMVFESAGVKALHVTYCEDGLWRAIFETKEQHSEPEASISVMASAIESLVDPLKVVWSRCNLREFNIGYDCGEDPWEFNQGLSNALLLRIATAGTSVRITLYPDRAETA